MMMNTFKTFLSNESGAVTVDWVVLTAAIVGLGLAVITSVRSGVTALGSDISTSLTSASVVSLGTLGSN
jgi:Flp pilus assembly pilin Flp